MVRSNQWRKPCRTSGGDIWANVKGIVEEEVGAADPDFSGLIQGEFDARIGAADGSLGGGLVGQGDEAGLGGAVELADPGVGGEGREGGAEGGVEFRAADEDQAEVGERVRAEDQAELGGGGVEMGDLAVVQGGALAVGAEV